MSAWEYRIVPAPTKSLKTRGIKGGENRFAHTLEVLMNDMAAEGWEFQRAETLPSIERAGLTGTTTEWRNVMVFRRARAVETEDFEQELLPAPGPVVELEPMAASEPDPSILAASLNKRALDDVSEADAHDVGSSDQFEHLKPVEGQKPGGRQGRGRRKRHQLGKNKMAQDTAQDTRSGDAKSREADDQASNAASEDAAAPNTSAFAQAIDEKSKD